MTDTLTLYKVSAIFLPVFLDFIVEKWYNSCICFNEGDSLNVKLLAYTPEPEKTVATAAKLCYSSSGISDLRDGLTDEKTASFIDMLVSIGHESVMEHVSFTFGIEGISRAC